MKLFYREKGKGKPLVILHGLWGASENWLPVANLLAEKYRVILPDMRNHGQSPHCHEMNYHVMAEDIATLITETCGDTKPFVVGHSMGGKTVMALLKKKPDMVKETIVVDIAPVDYSLTDGGDHEAVIRFMKNTDLSAIHSREELTQLISTNFKSERSRNLFLKNIKRGDHGFTWKVNHSALAANFHEIGGFPEELKPIVCTKKILFIKAELSNLIANFEILKKDFPKAQLKEIKNCTHWLHTEQPVQLAEIIDKYFSGS